MLCKTFYAVFPIFLLSCSTPTKQISLEEQFAQTIKNNYEQNALKNSSSFVVTDLNILRIDTVSKNMLDTQLLVSVHNKISYYNTLSELYESMAKTNARLNALAKKAKQGTLKTISQDDKNDDLNSAKIYKDSALYYKQIASSNSYREISNKAPELYFKVRFFLKASEIKYEDTIGYFGLQSKFLTMDKKIIDLEEMK